MVWLCRDRHFGERKRLSGQPATRRMSSRPGFAGAERRSAPPGDSPTTAAQDVAPSPPPSSVCDLRLPAAQEAAAPPARAAAAARLATPAAPEAGQPAAPPRSPAPSPAAPVVGQAPQPAPALRLKGTPAAARARARAPHESRGHIRSEEPRAAGSAPGPIPRRIASNCSNGAAAAGPIGSRWTSSPRPRSSSRRRGCRCLRATCRIDGASEAEGSLKVSADCEDLISFTPRSVMIALSLRHGELVYSASGDAALATDPEEMRAVSGETVGAVLLF